MAISSAVCTSFKVELLKGVHNFTASRGNTFKIALYQAVERECSMSRDEVVSIIIEKTH